MFLVYSVSVIVRLLPTICRSNATAQYPEHWKRDRTHSPTVLTRITFRAFLFSIEIVFIFQSEGKNLHFLVAVTWRMPFYALWFTLIFFLFCCCSAGEQLLLIICYFFSPMHPLIFPQLAFNAFCSHFAELFTHSFYLLLSPWYFLPTNRMTRYI